MFKKIAKFVRGLFSRNFIVPAVNEKLATAVDDKIKAHSKKTEIEQAKYTKIMADHLATFFARKYTCDIDSQLAFDIINREWKQLVRQVNSTNRHLNLKKDEFERQVKIVLEKRIKQKA